jgi:soluble lytic murein transglycosylase
MYGLTRSESFFDPTVSSVAGAKCLTQLMESTAGDIAKKLHYAEYDLNDPRTNIEFGCYYISGLLVKFNGSMLPALFGYNAGPGRINTWIKNAETEFSKQSLPMDIFLESIPYSETREYGRKVVAAGCMYAYLYQNEHITKTVGRMLR